MYDYGRAEAVQSDGKIVVTGEKCTNPSGTMSDFLVLRFTGSGALDASFGANGVATYNVSTDDHDYGDAVAVQPDGKIVVVGHTYIDYDYAVLTTRLIGQAVNLIAPNGGEIIPSGYSTYQIKWSTPPNSVKFTLKYPMDNNGAGLSIDPPHWTPHIVVVSKASRNSFD